jgi:hypothetical protein
VWPRTRVELEGRQWIAQPAQRRPKHAGHRLRHQVADRYRTGVAVGGIARRSARIDEQAGQAAALQLECHRQANDATPDHRDVDDARRGPPGIGTHCTGMS